ncbi:hypothetical protein GNY06_03505 [Elizabethkingia argentiflava]|uniref:Outer membrane insertion C-signal n=1 Tax=Elizabethkingia argenteiflava TaxID=2681556 RepID=A0A845PQA7_9FLAO|nr:hypothetical protein [Elizabethkingia argenteiflava]NAW50489.1 hypothetical protein [Elizabethkingia argenteiflava]
MKKTLKSLFLVGGLFMGTIGIGAQTYKNSLGLSIDFGDGYTAAGPVFKHFFNRNNAGQAEIIFGNHATLVQAFYSYNEKITNTKGLNWYVGIGPALEFIEGGDTYFGIRPMLGLEYKITQTPVILSFDWRPAFLLTDGGSSQVGRFGLGLKFNL